MGLCICTLLKKKNLFLFFQYVHVRDAKSDIEALLNNFVQNAHVRDAKRDIEALLNNFAHLHLQDAGHLGIVLYFAIYMIHSLDIFLTVRGNEVTEKIISVKGTIPVTVKGEGLACY